MTGKKGKNTEPVAVRDLVRPTSDKVRAAVFSTLIDNIDGAAVLDLFAGTGAVGIEAYSRGARFVTFLDKDTTTLEKNIKLLPQGVFKIIKSDIFKTSLNGSFDIIYIDPPYEIYKAKDILNWIKSNNLLSQNGIIAYEESSRLKEDLNEYGFAVTKQRRYGDTLITYLENL